MESMEEKGSVIQEFYRDANIFITGCTGFMGKVLMEKLLRSCPYINKIYVLVRRKKGKDMHTRLEDIFNEPLFMKLKQEQPKFCHKVTAVSGDCIEPGLGLSPSDRQLLAEEVDVVFHCAATVRFDEKLRIAVGINVRGTESVLQLAREMRRLKVIIHVSTAYCNCPLPEIEEKFYDLPLSHKKVTNIVDNMDDNMLDKITPDFLGNWPNTYAYTKAVSEDLVREQGVGMPIGVFRPAIVLATRTEPLWGWIDNVYGPTGVFIGAGIGLMRTLHCDLKKVANLVPVDMTINALIVSAWDVAKKPRAESCDDIPIYNYVSSVQKPLTWEEFMEKTSRFGFSVPPAQAVWYYSFTLNKYYFIHLLYVLFLHFLPAVLIDGVAMLFGKQTNLVKIYKKIHRFNSVISYFATREWKFTNDNVQALWKKVDAKDRRLFDFDIDGLDWEEYFFRYVRGIRVYLMKDDLSTVPVGIKKNKRLRWAHQVVKTLVLLLLLRIIWAIFNFIFL
ncbi:fatty acyl-CoA reductase wat-like [Periplaneta americana]|uniref:fatty acyl-CoA reductase wat-like n=1 Tax=Periplaneta americana TaxID=6978 RepID=UPI0037E82A8D